jgi:hypothetical protein
MTVLAAIYRRQGLEITDWEKYEAHKAERKAQNVANAKDVLTKNCIAFEELPGRVGTDQLVAFNVFKPVGIRMDEDVQIPFYPEIGKWVDLDYNVHFGVRNLARYITGDPLC